jgi:hypothetical protein
MFTMRFCVNKGGGLGMSLKKVTMPLSHQESGSSSLDAAAGSSRSIKQLLTITQPDDWHLHLRDNDGLAAVAPHRFYNNELFLCMSFVHRLAFHLMIVFTNRLLLLLLLQMAHECRFANG